MLDWNDVENPPGRLPNLLVPQACLAMGNSDTPASFKHLGVSFPCPICSMYGIVPYICLKCMVNVAKYSIYGVYCIGT